MKSFLVCVAVLGLVSSSLGMDFLKQLKDDPKTEEYRKECAKEVGIEPDFIEKALKEAKPDFKKFETHEAKCFMRCFLTKLELLKDDEINIEKIKETFNASDDIIEKGKVCVAENTQKDPCDRIFEIKKCIMTAIFKGKVPA